jgi:hypothetical protein
MFFSTTRGLRSKLLPGFSARFAPALDIGGAALIDVVHDFLALPSTILSLFLRSLL